MAEGDDASAGERGGVDQVGCSELAGVGETVGQDKPAFGIGVDNLNGLAGFVGGEGHGRLHVAGFLRSSGRHVFRRADHRDYAHLGLE